MHTPDERIKLRRRINTTKGDRWDLMEEAIANEVVLLTLKLEAGTRTKGLDYEALDRTMEILEAVVAGDATLVPDPTSDRTIDPVEVVDDHLLPVPAGHQAPTLPVTPLEVAVTAETDEVVDLVPAPV